MSAPRHCERSEAIQPRLDRFVASLLAMTKGVRIAIPGCLVGFVALGAAVWWIAALGPAPLGRDLAFSTRVVDRDGRLLRAYATAEGRWRLPARIADVDPRLFAMLFAYEDKRFRDHPGVMYWRLAVPRFSSLPAGGSNPAARP
jgi:membrane carboxypeptidase/penicillin-binding protein PbpC